MISVFRIATENRKMPNHTTIYWFFICFLFYLFLFRKNVVFWVFVPWGVRKERERDVKKNRVRERTREKRIIEGEEMMGDIWKGQVIFIRMGKIYDGNECKWTFECSQVTQASALYALRSNIFIPLAALGFMSSEYRFIFSWITKRRHHFP